MGEGSEDREDNMAEISHLLSERGFAYRLSVAALTHSHDVPSKPPSRYAAAWDGILSDMLLQRLDMTFCPTSNFWDRHEYSDGSAGIDPSPYFSYIVPLDQKDTGAVDVFDSRNKSALDVIIDCIRRQVSVVFPAVSECKHAEWWAHCRPHSSGHQLHFDSDDEGRGGVRNPVCSTVINLSTDTGVGGETLITTQTSTGKTLASKGWLCSNKRNRLLSFRGDLLHGVIPGPRVPKSDINDCDATMNADAIRSRRRVTFMVAFWKDIRTQDDEGHGSARPFSRVANEAWAKPLSDPIDIEKDKKFAIDVARDCFFQVPAWEDVDVAKNKGAGASLKEIRKYKLALPPYQDFFQFFS